MSVPIGREFKNLPKSAKGGGEGSGSEPWLAKMYR